MTEMSGSEYTALVPIHYANYDFAMKMVDPEISSPNHGGDISVAEVHFGSPVGGWLDLSTGINPTPYPDLVLSPAALSDLPTASCLAASLNAARASYGVADEASLCAAPGTQALLQVLPRIVDPKGPVAVLSPTYSEHAHLWRVNGYPVMEIDDLDAVGDAAVVVIVNPNNPDGRLYDVTQLEALRAKLAAAGGLLVVDEAFADVTPEISMASSAGREGLLVLRSFGKFFGLAGLRLGFAIGDQTLIDMLAARLGPWAVSGPALEIGERALRDTVWIDQTRDALASARARLDKILMSSGLEIIGGTDLFRLIQARDANTCYEQLGRAGILVRRFEEQPGWLRFGLPGDDAGFDRLSEALAG